MPNLGQLQTINSIGQTAVKLAPLTGPAAPFVAAGGAIVSAISSLIPPRGNFQKFQRTAYPYMAQQAKVSGLPVVIQWFQGEIVGVSPDGSMGVIDSSSDNPPGYSSMPLESLPWVMRLHEQGAFYVAACLRTDGDCVNNPASLHFEYIAPDPIQSIVGTVKDYIKNPVTIFLIVGGLVLLLFLRR